MTSTRSFVAVAILGCLAAPAQAYVDPGTGSILVQAIIGAIAVAAFTLRHYWYKLKSFLRFKKDPAAETPGKDNSAPKQDD